jgi:dolichol-phosphate mannosyltransferase
MDRSEFCDISIIIPVLNEEDSILQLAREVEQTFEDSPWEWECVWVDDGSTDQTPDRLEILNLRQPRHRYVQLDGTHGQSAALAAGFGQASGEILATLDGDLQNDPEDLPGMIRELESSDLHMINGIRIRRSDPWKRRLLSRTANGFRNWMTRSAVTDAGCSTRVFYNQCVDAIPHFRGMHRFLPTLVEMQGFRMKEVPVNHRPRRHGRSRYGVHNRVWVGFVDTLWVRWLKLRSVRPALKADSEEGSVSGLVGVTRDLRSLQRSLD